VPKTIQIRDVPDDVYAGLRRRAAEEGTSVPEMLRAEAARLATQPSVRAWVASTQRRSSGLDAQAVVAALDELRSNR
jgi:plasmid stability protein